MTCKNGNIMGINKINTLKTTAKSRAKALKRQEDEKLKEAAREVISGNTESFEIIVSALEKKVLATCYNFVNNAEETQEMAQEVFLKVFKSLKRFKFNSALSTWVYRICVNCCIDTINNKKRKFNNQALGGDIHEQTASKVTVADSVDKIIIKKEINEKLLNEIMNLSPKHKEAIVLHDFNYLSCKEIAQITKNSEGTIMSRLFHARKKLYSRLKGYMRVDG